MYSNNNQEQPWICKKWVPKTGFSIYHASQRGVSDEITFFVNVTVFVRWLGGFALKESLKFALKLESPYRVLRIPEGDAKSSILCAPIKMLRFPWNRLLLLLLLSLLLLILLLYKRVLERRVLLCTVEPGPFVKFLISAEWVVARKMLIANCCARDLSPSCRVSILHGCRSVALKTCQIEAGVGGGKVVDRHRYTGREMKGNNNNKSTRESHR